MTNDDLLTAVSTELAASPYQPIGFIGRGGMGAVIEAQHRTLGHRVVVKVVTKSNRPDLEDRLRVEAQLLARVQHPNVLAVIDLIESPSGKRFLVTERLEGKSLRALLDERGFLPPGEAIDIARQTLAGLAAAHVLGLVHRDLKPDNLFVIEGASRHIKVIDFGIAKIVAGKEVLKTALQNIAPLERPTATGMMVGSMNVIAPEQVAAKKIDQRTDLYALGVVLFRMLTGEYPFRGADHAAVAIAHATEPPRVPSEIAAQPIPPALDAAVLRALEKDPDARFQSAEEMIEALIAIRDPAAYVSLAPPPDDADTEPTPHRAHEASKHEASKHGTEPLPDPVPLRDLARAALIDPGRPGKPQGIREIPTARRALRPPVIARTEAAAPKSLARTWIAVGVIFVTALCVALIYLARRPG
jgi:eukaryotic-like serine/threonine-protein kinase